MSKLRWWLILALRLFIGAIFVYAAYTKLRMPWMLFAMSVDSYQILPEWGVEIVARVLPWTELILGALLILGLVVRWAAVGSTALLTVFFSAIVRAYSLGLTINCGCFSTNEALNKVTILRDGSFLAASLILTILAFLARRRARQTA